MTKPTISHVPSKDAYQPIHPPSLARVLIYHSLDSLEAVEGTADVQTDLSLHCRFCHKLAQIKLIYFPQPLFL